MAMNNPVHPGAIVREDCLKPLGLTVTEGAKRLGVGRQTLSNLVNEKASRLHRDGLSSIEGLRLDSPRRGLACNWPSTSRGSATSSRQYRSNGSPLRSATLATLVFQAYESASRLDADQRGIGAQTHTLGITTSSTYPLRLARAATRASQASPTR